MSDEKCLHPALLLQKAEAENADLRAKLAEAERKLADALGLCASNWMRGADAARREAMRLCNEIAYDEEGMHIRPDATECEDAIEARIGQPAKEGE